MQRYSPDYIKRMGLGERISRSLNGQSFPGGVPTRLYIRLSTDDGDRRTVHYLYNGKRSNSVLRRARRQSDRLRREGIRFTSVLIEYTPNIVLYSGDLYTGATSPHFGTYYVQTPTANRVLHALYPTEAMSVVRFRGRAFYIPSSAVPGITSDADWEILRKTLRLKLRMLRG